MKKLRLLIIVSVILCCLSAVVGCKNNELNAPTNLVINEETLELTWNKVGNADSYMLKINDKEIPCRKNSYDGIAALKEGKYSISVMALGDGEEFENSEWSKVMSYDRAKESEVTYKMTTDGKAYEVVNKGSAGSYVEVDAEYRGKPVIGIADAAFANARNITEIVLPDTITYIGKRAFYSCISLKSVNIPDSVETIGERSFQSCGELLSISLPENVTTIGEYMFTYCRKLTSVTMGSHVTEIGERAFSDCESLTNIVLPDTVTTIKNYAFSGCTGAETIDIGDNVKTIGEYAFYRCSKLSSFTIGDKVESFGKYAFAYCTELTSIEIPEKITKISAFAFSGNAKLASVDFGENIVEIDEGAFLNTKIWVDSSEVVYVNNWFIGVKDDAKSNSRFTINEETVGIASRAFLDCNIFTSISIPNSVKYIGSYAFYSTKLMGIQFGNDEIQEGEGVVHIGPYAFGWCKDLQTVKINGEELTVIDNYAFYGCSMLRALDLPNSVRRIGTYAFYNTGLWTYAESVVYVDNWAVGCKPDVFSARVNPGTVGISDYAFYSCSALQAISLPDTIKYVGIATFYKCKALEKVVIPEGVVEVTDYMFFECDMLNTVEIPSTVTKIGRSAFYKCLNLKQIVIPGSVETITEFAFFNCLTLQTAIIGEGVKSIGKRAFQYCEQLTEITLPNSLEELGSHVFFSCKALKMVNMGNSLERIETYTFYNCGALQQVVIPDGIKYIGTNAFRQCSSMIQVTFGNGITEIDDFAFYGCALNTLKLPTNITTIGNYAFKNNENLKNVIIHSGITEFGKHVIHGCKNLTLYIEDGTNINNWEETWNSYFRPVIWDVTLSSDKSYVVSVKINSEIDNPQALNGMSEPSRLGYTFDGWATTENGSVKYDMTNVKDAPKGTTLFAVWTKNNQ